LVVAALDGSDDLAWLQDWATSVTVSVPTLRRRCYAAGVSPRAALHLVRLLRALVRARGKTWDIAAWLDAEDPRTLAALVKAGGIPARSPRTPAIDIFLDTQRIVAPDSAAIVALRQRLADREKGGERH
jgi:hypothetical protein